MYNKSQIEQLIKYIKKFDGIGDKEKLSQIIQKKFNLLKDRKVLYGNDFSIRFSKAKSKKICNTILSLSTLQKYDNKPFIVCVVTPNFNYLLLANTTFLKKISHSSQNLRIDNIRGSFNGSDIMLKVGNFENEPNTFESLFAYHMGLSFQDNLERLVESTNGIVGKIQKFDITNDIYINIFSSIKHAINFVSSAEYIDLKSDLDLRVIRAKKEIIISSSIDNVNIRGRIIEYLITNDDPNLREEITHALYDKKNIPNFKTNDKLGDYTKKYFSYYTETDIKTKSLFLHGNPKAYNIDKLLKFLATKKAVYMIYILGIDKNGDIISRLCSIFDKRLIDATNIVHHWAGRNSRGTAQFIGTALTNILHEKPLNLIDNEKAEVFLRNLINQC